MPNTPKRHKIPGSNRKALPNAKVVGDVSPSEQITITVVLRRRSDTATAQAAADRVLNTGEPLSRDEFAAQLGADPDDVNKIEAFAHDHHLTVSSVDTAARTIKLTGTLADLTAAFKPKLKRYRAGSLTFRGRTGDLTVPSELDGIIQGVFGFDNRPAARPHVRERVAVSGGGFARPGRGGTGDVGTTSGVTGVMTPRNAADGSLSALDIAKLYHFPTGLDGSGQTIAIVELGGGFSAKDLTTYFKSLGVPKPSVVAVGVDGGHNAPGDPADGEVMLDIEVTGAVAPKAKIAVYFAPNTDQGFLDALNAAVHDTVRKPSVVSISWGAPEDVSWSTQAVNAFHNALQDAATLGVTVCCAAGDDGSSDIRDTTQRDGKPHCDFPASSPFALACGGTKLNGTSTAISSEVVWNEGNTHGATGGGVSTIFPLPSYQANAGVPQSITNTAGRGVPDVAGDADPLTGYQIVLHGKKGVIGGTSAVAPLWAGLIALLNQRLAVVGKKSVGFLQPFLYAHATGVLNDITSGNNDIDGTLKKYAAGKGWDACTGLGTPDGTKLLKALGG